MSLYVPRKILKAAKPGSSKNRAKVEHTQRVFALGFLSQLEETTRRWADKVNKKETK
jgi:hypothetical protein